MSTPVANDQAPPERPSSNSSQGLQQQQQQPSQQQHEQAISNSQQTVPTSSQPTCSVATTPTVVPQLSQAPRGATPAQMRPGEYIVLLTSPNPRQPGIQGIRYNYQPNILQPNQALFRGINASQIIRTPISSSGVMQPQTSQAHVTSMANIPGGHVQIPFSTASPRGPITLTSSGQTMIPSMPMQRHQLMGSRTIIQQPTLIRGVSSPNIMSSVIPPGSQLTPGIQMPIGSPIVQQAGFISSNATAPSQMTPEDALTKGVVFLKSIHDKAQNKEAMTALIQALIDGKKTSKEFAVSLQQEFNSSSPQSQLVPFLELMLPPLRQSLSSGAVTLPGIKTPVSSDSPSKVQSNSGSAKKKKTPLPPGQKTQYAIKKEAREARKREKEILLQGFKDSTEDSKDGEKTAKPKTDRPKSQSKQKRQEKQLESLSSSLRDDDDVNDVAAMGGVNLAEESQRIMASGSELVGTQIRSCKDEPFLDNDVLTARVARITSENNLSEPSREVITLISHATQERLKNLVERLGVLAQQRSENLRHNPKYEVSNDVKGQMKFLAELDRIEKRRYEETERELLLKMAKSRSKVEDPEQLKLRQKAKDMQRAEQEEVRQREANETALLAIGSRKKMKTSASVSSFGSQLSGPSDIKTSNDIRSDAFKRVKRVNMRDLQTLFELDRTHLNRLIKITSQ